MHQSDDRDSEPTMLRRTRHQEHWRAVGTHYGPTRIYADSTGLQAMTSEGRHSWHSGAHPPPPSSPGRVTLSEDSGLA